MSQKRLFFCNLCGVSIGAGAPAQGYGIEFKSAQTASGKKATTFEQRGHAEVEHQICEQCLDACKRFRSEYSVPRLAGETSCPEAAKQ